MRIAFVFNVRHKKPALDVDAQAEAEFDEPSTIKAIHDAIVANGYECIAIEANIDAYAKLKKEKDNIDLVFNIAEGLRGEIREAHIPAILEMLGIPYTHSGALADAISLDKGLTKKIWQFHGLPTPKFVTIGAGEKPFVEARLPAPERSDGGQGLKFPLIVKPNGEGSSKGIFNDNVVDTHAALIKKIRALKKTVGDGIIIEEFMPGREFTVSVLGNDGIGKGIYILPIVEQNYDVFPDTLAKFASYEAKWFFEDSLDDPSTAYICPAKIPSSLENLIRELCIKAYKAINCRDIARIDLRLDAKGRPHLLEINTLPGMIADPNVVSYYPVAARTAGWDFNRMIGQVITHARERLAI